MRGCTIDQILGKLREMTPEAPSRSALGRHMLRVDAMAEKIRRSREVATALVSQFGDATEGTTARLNIEFMHSAVLDLFMKAAEGEDDDIAEGGRAALAGEPEQAMFLAKALDHLASASRKNEAFLEAAKKRAEAEARQNAAAVAETVSRRAGVAPDTIRAIKAEILGVKA